MAITRVYSHTLGSIVGVHLKSLPNLEYLRGLAALLVFLSHYAQNFKLLDSPVWFAMESFGNFGVDLFFVLSGFVITLSIWDRPRSYFPSFISGRARRMLPLYLTFTIFASTVIASAQAIGVEFSLPRFSFEHLLASVSFTSQVSGYGFPIIGQGWTLEYEVAFYLVAGLAIVFMRPGLARMSLLIILLGGLGLTLSPLFFEFLFGVFAGTIFKANKVLEKTYPGILGWTIAGIGIVTAWQFGDVSNRWWAWGLSATLVIVGLSLAKSTFFVNLAMTVGQVSYPFYLLQWLSLPVAARLLTFEHPALQILTFAIVLTTTCAASWVLYKFFDEPVKSWLRGMKLS